jgi:hypothetical protein
MAQPIRHFRGVARPGKPNDRPNDRPAARARSFVAAELWVSPSSCPLISVIFTPRVICWIHWLSVSTAEPRRTLCSENVPPEPPVISLVRRS